MNSTMVELSPIEEKVLKALEQIRPFLVEDGGDVELLEVTNDNIVRVEFKGACRECGMNGMTFTAGVEEAILKSVPEVVRVEATGIVK